MRRANLASSIAHYDEAATAYQRYASRYGGEKDAAHALNTAVVYHRALGHDRLALAGLENFIKRYGKKQPAGVVEALLNMAALHESQGNRKLEIDTYRRYIKEVGSKGGTDRLLIVHAKLGELLWKQSCTNLDKHGSCVRIRRHKRGITRCGPESLTRLEVVARHPRHVQEARKNFAQVLKLEKRGVVDDAPERRRSWVVYWLEATRFYMLEQRLERVLGRAYPKMHDNNDPKFRKASVQWNRDSDKLLREFMRSYRDVGSNGGGAEWTIAGAARVGQIAQQLSDVLLTVEIPKKLRSGANKDQICHGLTAQAAPLEDIAVSSYALCLDLTIQLNQIGSWSRLCEAKLQTLRPSDFPAGLEIQGKPDAIGYQMAIEPMIH